MCKSSEVLTLPRNRPATRDMFQTDLRVIGFRGRGRDEDQRCLLPGGQMRFADKTPSDALTLIFSIDSQIGEIAAIGEVGDGPRHTDETIGIPGGHDNIGMAEHHLETRNIPGWPSFGQCGCDKNFLKLFGGQAWFQRERDRHDILSSEVDGKMCGRFDSMPVSDKGSNFVVADADWR